MVSHDSATDTRIIGEVARLALAASTIFFVINIDDGPPLLRGKFRVAIERKRKRPTADYRFSSGRHLLTILRSKEFDISLHFHHAKFVIKKYKIYTQSPCKIPWKWKNSYRIVRRSIIHLQPWSMVNYLVQKAKRSVLSKRRWPYPRGPLTRSKETREGERRGWRIRAAIWWSRRVIRAWGVGKDSFTYIGAVAHCRDKASVGDVKCCQKQRTPLRDTNGNQKWSWRKTRGDAAQKGDELFSLSRRPFSNFQGKKFETGLAHFEPGDFELFQFFDGSALGFVLDDRTTGDPVMWLKFQG